MLLLRTLGKNQPKVALSPVFFFCSFLTTLFLHHPTQHSTQKSSSAAEIFNQHTARRRPTLQLPSRSGALHLPLATSCSFLQQHPTARRTTHDIDDEDDSPQSFFFSFRCQQNFVGISRRDHRIRTLSHLSETYLLRDLWERMSTLPCFHAKRTFFWIFGQQSELMKQEFLRRR